MCDYMDLVGLGLVMIWTWLDLGVMIWTWLDLGVIIWTWLDLDL